MDSLPDDILENPVFWEYELPDGVLTDAAEVRKYLVIVEKIAAADVEVRSGGNVSAWLKHFVDTFAKAPWVVKPASTFSMSKFNSLSKDAS